MKIVKLTSKEFEDFAKKNKYVTFHQKESWGKLKENNGWQYEMVGFKDKKKVIYDVYKSIENDELKVANIVSNTGQELRSVSDAWFLVEKEVDVDLTSVTL